GVAVAGGLAPAAIGSDTGGSIRAPAAVNGLAGLKTTHGLISLHGTIALSPSLDTIGPMTRTAEDAGLLTAALAGPDLRDDGTLQCPLFHFDRSLASVRGLRIAVMRPAQYPLPVSDDIARATNNAVSTLRTLGAIVTEIDLPFDFAELMRQAGALMAIEAHYLHASYIGDAALPIGPWVRKRIIAGGAASAGAHLSLLAHRREAIARFKSWMQSHDLLLTPTLPFVACPVSDIDEEVTPVGAFNRAVNYLDACAISLPAGFSENGLPIGVQLIAPAWHDAFLLQAGQAFQQATDWHRRIPPDLE
ncbi:MAG: amidase, partial [Herminiimonas sp.]|nr:amidase [Herminiimonas sp.]